MRMRDRQSLLAALILAAGYAAFLLWSLRTAGTFAGAVPPMRIHPTLQALMAVNGGLLLWRLGMRFGFAAGAYGWREGLRAVPRAVVGNVIAMLAARQAVVRFARRRWSWDKTAHAFPQQLPAE
ncbi:MAG: hypothetical protein M3N07_09335 [Pseudomonadota bacterium]|nr:hypothetical protein [Pseudomonadota bacterium]